MAVGSPRVAREAALALVLEDHAQGGPPAAALADLPLPPDPFAAELVAGVGTNEAELDDLIGRYAVDWTLDRLAVIDRTVLRIAVFELLHHPEIPTGAVVSEAVELAKTYSTDESGRFV